MSVDRKARGNGARPKRAPPRDAEAVTEFGILLRPFGFVDARGNTEFWRAGVTVAGSTLAMLCARGAAITICPDPATPAIEGNHVGHDR